MRIIPSPRSQRAFTILEFVFASGIGALCSVALLSLVIQFGQQERRTGGDSTLETEAAILEDKIATVVRAMSVTESVTFGMPHPTVTNAFRQVIIARGPTPDYPREEIKFNSDNGKVTYDPNRSVSGDSISVFTNKSNVRLTDLYFYPSLKTGNIPDSATLNVVMKFDDNGYAQRRDASGNEIMNTTISRYFTVRMRSF